MKVTSRSQACVDYLKSALKKGSALVLMHDNPDPDCLAAGLCLKKIFEESYDRSTLLAYSGAIGRAENRRLVADCGIPAQRIKSVRLEDFSFIAMVDCQPGAGNNLMPAHAPVQMVVDHHPRLTTTRRIPWVDVRPKYGTTTTIAFQYLAAHGLELNRREATALLYALKSETRDLGEGAGPADRSAYFALLPKSDFDLLFRITHAEVTREYFQVMSNALENTKIHHDVMVTALGEVGAPEYVSEAADMLIRLKGIEWTLVSGRHQGALYLSIRARSHDVNAGEVMHQILEGYGTGGGHETMAGGKIIPPNPFHDFHRIEEELARRFLHLLRKKSSPGADLL